MPENIETFSTRLESAILSAGISQATLAELIGTNPSTIQRWLKGKAEPSFFKIAKAAEVLNVSTSWLACEEKTAVNSPEKIISDLQKLLNVQPLAPVEPIKKGLELPDHVPDEVIHLLRKFPAKADWKVISSFLEQSLKLLDSEQSREQVDPDAQDR